MTGTIKTLRAEKGFGFINDNAGKEFFFHQSAIYGEGLTTCAWVTASNSRSAKARKAPGPRTSGARPPSGRHPITGGRPELPHLRVT